MMGGVVRHAVEVHVLAARALPLACCCMSASAGLFETAASLEAGSALPYGRRWCV